MRDKKEALYTTVYNDIIAKIKQGEYKVGDKLPTELELTKIYGVSRITVARALNDLANINLVYRVKKSGTIVNGKLDRKNTQLLIPIILPFADKYNAIFKGIESIAVQNNIFTPFYNTKNNVKRERDALEEVLKSNTDGIIIYPCFSRDNLDVYSELLAKKIPVVCIDRGITGLATPLVTSTNAKNMEQIVTLLAKRGHTEIGFLSVNDSMAITEEERFRGYCAGMIKNNLRIHSEYIFDNSPVKRKETTLTQAQQSKQFDKYITKCLDEYEKLPTKPTAICCINDRSMSALMREASARGIRVPEELTITGFDCVDEDFVRENRIINVKQNFFELGATAIRLMLKILDGQNYLMKEQIDGTLMNFTLE